MSRFIRIFLLAGVFLVVPSACAPLTVSTPDSNALGTMVAQTVFAGLTQQGFPTGAAQTETLLPEVTPTITPTFPPTFSPTPTETPVPLFTPTSTVPVISVSVPTNCRVGPGRIYDRVGALPVGVFAEVLGRDPTGNYWYIRNPGAGAQFCWVWGEYAALTGPFQFLPVFTPPPTPTATSTPTPSATPTPAPGFTAKFAGLDFCSDWWVEIELKNTGATPFRSMEIEIFDTVTKVKSAALVNTFTNLDGCLKKTTKDVLGPGETFTISAPEFAYDPTGNRLRATIMLCSRTGQKGVCVTETIAFKP